MWKIVKMLEDCPRIVWVDRREYGPFYAGEVYALPKDLGELFVLRKIAEEVR